MFFSENTECWFIQSRNDPNFRAGFTLHVTVTVLCTSYRNKASLLTTNLCYILRIVVHGQTFLDPTKGTMNRVCVHASSLVQVEEMFFSENGGIFYYHCSGEALR